MTTEEFRTTIKYVPPQFADFVLDNGTRILKEHGFPESEVAGRYSAFLERCSLLLSQFKFDKLHDAITAFASELRQLRADLNAKARNVDQFAPLRAWGWDSDEVSFVERSLSGNERVERVDKKNCHLNSGRDLNRQSLREKFKPADWTNLGTWFAQFPSID
jgi:hypothetical protein